MHISGIARWRIVFKKSAVLFGWNSIAQHKDAMIVGMPKVIAYIVTPHLLINKLATNKRDMGRVKSVPVTGAMRVKPEKMTVWLPNVRKSDKKLATLQIKNHIIPVNNVFLFT